LGRQPAKLAALAGGAGGSASAASTVRGLAIEDVDGGGKMSWSTLEVVVNSSAWTPVNAPFDCDVLSIRNTAASPVRYSPDEGQSEDLLEAGAQFSILVERNTKWWLSGGPRFAAGRPAVYLKSLSGTFATKVTFVR
jgi:hypothetical protein